MVKGGSGMGIFELAVVAVLAALALAVFLRARRRGNDDTLARQLGELAESMRTGNAVLADRLERLASSGQESQRAMASELNQQTGIRRGGAVPRVRRRQVGWGQHDRGRAKKLLTAGHPCAKYPTGGSASRAARRANAHGWLVWLCLFFYVRRPRFA